MAKIVLQTEVAADFAAGETEHDIDAQNVRQLINRLDERFPGIGERLRERTAVAIDGEIFQDPLLQTIHPASEVYFLPMIEGG
jgi:molybdopterin converting factor small subunit